MIEWVRLSTKNALNSSGLPLTSVWNWLPEAADSSVPWLWAALSPIAEAVTQTRDDSVAPTAQKIDFPRVLEISGSPTPANWTRKARKLWGETRLYPREPCLVLNKVWFLSVEEP